MSDRRTPMTLRELILDRPRAVALLIAALTASAVLLVAAARVAMSGISVGLPSFHPISVPTETAAAPIAAPGADPTAPAAPAAVGITSTTTPTTAPNRAAQVPQCEAVLDQFAHAWPTRRTLTAQQWQTLLQPITTTGLLNSLAVADPTQLPAVTAITRTRLSWMPDVCEATYQLTPAKAGRVLVSASRQTGTWLVTDIEPTR